MISRALPLYCWPPRPSRALIESSLTPIYGRKVEVLSARSRDNTQHIPYLSIRNPNGQQVLSLSRQEFVSLLELLPFLEKVEDYWNKYGKVPKEISM